MYVRFETVTSKLLTGLFISFTFHLFHTKRRFSFIWCNILYFLHTIHTYAIKGFSVTFSVTYLLRVKRWLPLWLHSKPGKYNCTSTFPFPSCASPPPLSLSLSPSLSLSLSTSPHKMIDAIRRQNAVFDRERPLLYPIPTWRMNSRMAILPGTSTEHGEKYYYAWASAKSLVSVSHMHKLLGEVARCAKIMRYNANRRVECNVVRKKQSFNLVLQNEGNYSRVIIHFLLAKTLVNLWKNFQEVNSQQIV